MVADGSCRIRLQRQYSIDRQFLHARRGQLEVALFVLSLVHDRLAVWCYNASMTSRTAFERLVHEALDTLPQPLLDRLDNVAVVVESQPTWEQRRKMRLRPGHTLLGLYEGIPRTVRDQGYNLVLPDKISIFQEPILAMCRTEEEVRQAVQRVVLHELAHHFGLSDDHLRAIDAY
jgi:predicted Zn-dependent protease with MMP-like domain